MLELVLALALKISARDVTSSKVKGQMIKNWHYTIIYTLSSSTSASASASSSASTSARELEIFEKFFYVPTTCKCAKFKKILPSCSG